MQILKMFITSAIIMSLAACSTTPDTAAPVDDKSTATSASNSGTSTSGTGGGASSTLGSDSNNSGTNNLLRDPKNPLSQRTIYYDYDSYVVRNEYRALLSAHAAYLNSNPNARIKVEGNTDERGSREYNLALGQKRAESVKQALTLLGVKEIQINTVSFGEEKPRNTATTETAFSENRRSDLLYAGE